MHRHRIDEIARWFLLQHYEWIQNNKLVSWAGRLGIELNVNGRLDESQLFHLFVLATLWNNKPTYRAEKGEEVFKEIRDYYRLENFREAAQDSYIKDRLRSIASENIHNPQVYSLLMFAVNGTFNGEKVWTKIKQILDFPVIGDREYDSRRLRRLYGIFNPPRYEQPEYLTVKIFLIFREIRIQFRGTGKYQYHPAICCVPDRNVRQALKVLNIPGEVGNDIDSLLNASQSVADQFCTEAYELYDLPLFFWYREKDRRPQKGTERTRQARGEHAGICPRCGSPLVWRRAQRTNELYRGCTNFARCRWNDRSY